MKLFRQVILTIITVLRSTSLRRPIMKLLVWLHNWSYHLISFFASHSGTHPKHKIQKYHDFFVSHVSANDRVLDIGCGHGDVSYDVAKKAKLVLGIDIYAPNIAIAQQKYRRDNLSFTVGDALTMDFAESFDAVILSNVLEHIERRVDFLCQLARLSPTILIRVPMITRDWISVYKKQEGFEYRLDDTHYIEYDQETFRREMTRANLHITSMHSDFGELYAVVRRPK